MIKIVVGTNIIFSAILNINSRIGQILLRGDNIYDFYAPKYLRSEIWEHHEKIKKIANLSEVEFLEIYEIILKNITILNHSIVEKIYYKQAVTLCNNIDSDDIPFVAFSLFLNCNLWTGDKKLINGLKKKGHKKLISTDVLFDDFLKRKDTKV